MCITFFCVQPKQGQSSNIEFLIGFNRDQKAQRASDPLMQLKQDPNIYAGRDCQSGGTWLGINIKTGILIILTNFNQKVRRIGQSRGKLVLGLLQTSLYEGLTNQQCDQVIQRKLCDALSVKLQYAAFNILAYNIQTSTIFYICSELQIQKPIKLQKKRSYGMANGALNDLWDKTKHGLSIFQEILKRIQMINPDNNKEQIERQKIRRMIFEDLQKLLKDKKRFHQNEQQQACIFISPYYNNIQKAQKMTKSSFIALIQRNSLKETFQIHMKQITYKCPNLQQSYVQFRKIIGQKQELNSS